MMERDEAKGSWRSFAKIVWKDKRDKSDKSKKNLFKKLNKDTIRDLLCDGCDPHKRSGSFCEIRRWIRSATWGGEITRWKGERVGVRKKRREKILEKSDSTVPPSHCVMNWVALISFFFMTRFLSNEWETLSFSEKEELWITKKNSLFCLFLVCLALRWGFVSSTETRRLATHHHSDEIHE